jgi:iron-sulfur cluster repair protein YtfE (RIC family)
LVASTLTNESAAAAIRAHHVELDEHLRGRVAALSDAVRSGTDHVPARHAVLVCLDEDVLPHAAAEEKVLYPAGDNGMTALLVRAMRNEHRDLVGRVERLRSVAGALDASTEANAILALFESHLAKENDLLIPALARDPNVSLASLLSGMHELVG